jgi:hypothetical protein
MQNKRAYLALFAVVHGIGKYKVVQAKEIQTVFEKIPFAVPAILFILHQAWSL